MTIFVAKRVRTFDAGRPMVEAIAIRGDKIVALGSRAELVKGSPGARVFELPNATIVPGLADAHGHLAGLGRSLSIVDLVETTTKQQVLERLKAATAASYQGNWLVGRGWDQTRWPKGQQDFPTRDDLDSIFPKTPVFLTRVDGHAAWVYSEALRRSGISRETKDPPGGRIVRDSRGEPTGVLVDNAMHQVESQLPAVDEHQLEARLNAALSHCAQLGLTAVHDAGMDSITFGILRRWDEEGRLPVRVYAMADGQGKDSKGYLAQGPYAGKMLSLRAVKFWFDGALGSRGAALDAPYADDSTQAGLLLIPALELEA
ncbi:MAG TPA: amidohydrolase family protein, partial [Myxococcales bacterium]